MILVKMNTQKPKELKVMQNSHKVLRVLSLFPTTTELRKNIPIRNVIIRYFMLNLSSCYYSVGAALHMVNSINNGIYEYIDKDLGNIISYHGATYLACRYILNLKYNVRLCREFSDFRSFGKPTDFDKRNNNLNKMSKMYALYLSILIFCMSISTLFYIPQCNENNLIKNQTEVCGLPAPTWLPFEFDHFPIKYMIFLYQMIAIVVAFESGGFISFVVFENLEHLVLRFEHVSHVFVDALSEKNKKIRRRKFKNAVKYHRAVIEMGKLLNKCFRQGMMIHISLTGPFIGIAGYTFLTRIPIDTLALLNGWMMATFIVCHGSQRLMEASTDVGNIMFKVDWYNLEADLQRDLLLVIIRSHTPVYLRAGPFGPMTYNTLMTILKTSYSYIALLKQSM